MSVAAPHVLAVDGNSLAHRAFHALKDEPERPDDWVADGVLRMLATAWSEGPFDAVVVGFDHPQNRRKLADAGYKANRDDKDPALAPQIERLRAVLIACGFTVAYEPGAEADDLLAAGGARCSRQTAT